MTVNLGVEVELMVEGVKRGVNHQGKVTCRGWTGGRASGGECCLEWVPLTKSFRSKPCPVNEYWEVGGRRSVGRREEVTRKERDAPGTRRM